MDVLAPAPAAGEGPAAAAASSQEQEELTWWQVLETLKASGCDGAALVALLASAHARVAKDPQWSSSGVPELLKRALGMATRGSWASARSYALNTLDFKNAASRYAQAAALGHCGVAAAGTKRKQPTEAPAHGDANSSSSTSSEVTSSMGCPQQHDVPRSSKKRQQPAATMSALERLATLSSELQPAPSSTSTGGRHHLLGSESPPAATSASFPAPEPPAKRRQTQIAACHRQSPAAAATQVVTAMAPRPMHEGRLHMPPPQPLPQAQLDASAAPAPSGGCSSEGGQQASGAAAGTCEWTGMLSLLAEDGMRASELCHVTLQVPRHVACFMPRTLQLTHLVQRRGVMLGEYQVVRTSIKKANMRQTSRLRSMAQHELVAVAVLEHMHVIVVPYMDGKAGLKLVSFVLAPSVATPSGNVSAADAGAQAVAAADAADAADA